MLSTLLSSLKGPSSIPLAFSIYDALRRPRRAAVAQSSMWAGRFLTGRDPDVGVDPEKMRAKLPTFQTTIFAVDLGEMQREAVRRLERGRVHGEGSEAEAQKAA